MGVFLRTENTENFVLLMNGFPKVPSLLLVPPASVGISELTLLTGRVLVAAILELREAPQSSIGLNPIYQCFRGFSIVPAKDRRAQQPEDSGLARKKRGGRSSGLPAGADAGSRFAETTSIFSLLALHVKAREYGLSTHCSAGVECKQQGRTKEGQGKDRRRPVMKSELQP